MTVGKRHLPTGQMGTCAHGPVSLHPGQVRESKCVGTCVDAGKCHLPVLELALQ